MDKNKESKIKFVKVNSRTTDSTRHQYSPNSYYNRRNKKKGHSKRGQFPRKYRSGYLSKLQYQVKKWDDFKKSRQKRDNEVKEKLQKKDNEVEEKPQKKDNEVKKDNNWQNPDGFVIYNDSDESVLDLDDVEYEPEESDFIEKNEEVAEAEAAEKGEIASVPNQKNKSDYDEDPTTSGRAWVFEDYQVPRMTSKKSSGMSSNSPRRSSRIRNQEKPSSSTSSNFGPFAHIARKPYPKPKDTFKLHDMNCSFCNCPQTEKFRQHFKTDLNKHGLLAMNASSSNVRKVSTDNRSSLKDESDFFQDFRSNYPDCSIKLAQCRLKKSQFSKNAFVCIYADNADTIEQIVTIAKENALKKDILYHDHAFDFKVIETKKFNSRYYHTKGHHLKEAENVGLANHVKFIFTKQMKNEYGCNVYDLPGGKRNLGERSEYCAIRETEEEASISLTLNDLKNCARAFDTEEVNVYFYIHAQDILDRLDNKN